LGIIPEADRAREQNLLSPIRVTPDIISPTSSIFKGREHRGEGEKEKKNANKRELLLKTFNLHTSFSPFVGHMHWNLHIHYL